MKVKMTNATKRNGIWHFRMNVPVDLQNHYGKATHSASLGTKDDLEAKKLADAKTAFFKAQHKQLRLDAKKGLATPVPVSSSSPTQLVAVVDTSVIDRHMKFIDHVDKLSNTKIKLALNRCGAVYKQVQHALQADDGLSVESLRGISLRTVLENGSNLYELCEHVSGKQDLSTNEHLRNMTARATIAMLLDYITKLSVKLSSLLRVPNVIQVSNSSQPVSSSPSSQLHQQTTTSSNATPVEKQPKTKRPLFSEVLKTFLNCGDHGDRGRMEIISSSDAFVQWTGDRPVADYTEGDLVDFKNNCLRKLPKYWTKIHEGKSIQEAVVIGPANRALTTRNNNMTSVRSVFSYAKKQRWIDINPATGVKESKPKESRRKNHSYSDDEIKKLFEILKYEKKKPSRYWMVLIALHNSFRANEICQLHTEDILEIDGIPCFDINENDKKNTLKSVKNHSSCRIVPVHPALIQAGFLKYVERRKEEVGSCNSLLFPDVTFSGAAHYTKSTCNWFNRTFKPKFKASDNVTQKGVHSLRHTFGRYAKNRARMNKDAEKVLMGHSSGKGDEVHDGYSVEEIQFLYDELKRLDYGFAVPANPYMESDSKES
jgi:integrase